MDYLISACLNQFALQCVWLDIIIIFFARYLPYLLMAVLFLFLLKDLKKYRQIGLEVLTSAVFSSAAVIIIRFFWQRPRPFVFENINLLFSHSASSAFPSLHSAFFFAISAVLLIRASKKLYPDTNQRIQYGLAVLFFSASILITVARVFAGLHWPSDILAGLAVGFISALLARIVVKRYFKSTSNWR